MHADKRFVTLLDRRPFNGDAVDWIRSIENNNVRPAFLARAHAKIERPNECVITRTDVLKIDQQNIDILQHLRRGLAMLSVQTINRNAESRMFVTFPFDHVVLGLTEEPMLRAEKRAQLKQFAI